MTLLVSVVLVTLGLARCITGTPAPPIDPCDPSGHKELNEPYRSTGFQTVYPHKPLCDIHLSYGWYRFTSQAGGTMPTSCPERFSCGTTVPIWMKGNHPSVSDGMVVREVCGDFLSGAPRGDPCCDRSIQILVKNCGLFYVYYLSPTPACPVSYCAGDAAPCPVGKWSEDNFSNCRDAYPLLTVAPSLTGPIIDGNQFYFQCEITYDILDPEQVFEVIWTFDGVQDPNVPTQNFSDPIRNETLDGHMLEHHINSKLDCRVRAFYRGNQEVKSEWLISNSYYVGILVSPATLIVSEREYSKDVSITSTIPVTCNHNRECCITFVLDISSDNDALIPNDCSYDLCSGDWDQILKIASRNVSVVANQDFITDGEKHLLITFEKLSSTGGGPYMDVFHGHQPDQVQVIVEDEEIFTCFIHSDPHIVSFDGETYSIFLLGDFTAYEVPDRDFQIQIRSWPCERTTTCICGVVIREQNDVIRIDECDQQYAGSHTSPTVEIGRIPLREGVVIQRSKDASTIGVYLLSGTRIRVYCSNTHLNVHIYGPGVDKNKARGICGTYDGDPNNEFTYPNGTVDSKVSNDFFEAWRASLNDSLFEVLPPETNVGDDFRYCTCNNRDQTINCTNSASIAPYDTMCHGCPPIDTTWTVITSDNSRRRKREAVYGDFDTFDEVYDLATVQSSIPTADPNQQWPNVAGITEAQAREMCTRALERSQLSSKCGGPGSSLPDELMTGCLADILYSGTTVFLDSTTSAFTSSCQLKLAKDPANYVTSPEGKQIMKPEYVDDICDLECDKHGSCGEKGVCVCDSGWEGFNCHIQTGIGPQVDRIRSGTLCDLAQRPCQRVFLDVSNVDLSDDLICRVQKIDDQDNKIGRPIDTEANFLSGFRIACVLPETTVSSQIYKVSASNDGSLFGNQVSVHVFDSTCLDCDETRCREKTTACHINNVCYTDGAIYVDNPLKVCDVSKDTSDWTDKTVCRGVQIADIIFVVDASASIGQSNFAQQLRFLSNLTKHFALGPDNVLFGAVVFASNAQKLFDLKDHSDHANLTEAILSTVYIRGLTNTAAALRLVADQNMFDPASGGRANATKIVIVITDGRSNILSQTIAAAQRLKDAGVQMISIGVGGNTREDELEQMANGPENVFEVSGFDVLSHIEEQVTKQTCGPA